MHESLLFGTCIVTAIAWQAISLLKSYSEARRIGLPIVLSPTRTLNPLWIILCKITPIVSLLQYLPFNLGRWARVSYMGWQFDDKDATHQELGTAFVLCTPGLNEVHLADPSAAHMVLTRRKEFIKPSVMYGQYTGQSLFRGQTFGGTNDAFLFNITNTWSTEPLNVFGRNLDAVEGDIWQRHRRLTAPNFNERVSSSVWSEARRQAGQMLSNWVRGGAEGTTNVVDDTAALALHVLTYAGFGIRHDFGDGLHEIEAPHQLTYRDALLTVLRNFTLLVIIPMNRMDSAIMPRAVRKVGEACREFQLYMREMVAKEKMAAAQRPESEANNLLSALVRASEATAAENRDNKAYAGKAGLADDELYGNLFIYNMAGHETTANTLATAIAYLAAQPRWQSWVREEIEKVASDSPSDLQSWEYEKAYPQLVRCQAVMLETLRIHGSTVFLPKSTGNSACALTIAGKEHIIPSGTFVVTNSQALHCNRDTWGADALAFRPNRWIKNTNGFLPGQEELFAPPPGTFVGWAEGPRICPGKKFSLVEFVGVMAVLFRHHQVRPKHGNGETEESSRRELERMIEDSGISAITLQMRHPQRVALVWTKI